MSKTKRCNNPECNKLKPLSEFDKNKKCTTDGHVGVCKDCRRAIQRRERAEIRAGRSVRDKQNNPTTEEKTKEYFDEMVIRGKEIEKINRIRKLPRDGKNLLLMVRRIDKVLDKYEKRCNSFSPSEIKKMDKRGCDKNY